MLPLHRLQCIVFSQCNVLVFTENFLGPLGFEGRKRKFKKLAKKKGSFFLGISLFVRNWSEILKQNASAASISVA